MKRNTLITPNDSSYDQSEDASIYVDLEILPEHA
jgi:hypothetical protein